MFAAAAAADTLCNLQQSLMAHHALRSLPSAGDPRADTHPSELCWWDAAPGPGVDAVAKAAGDGANVTLDIIVEGVGRTNTGLLFDVKGLTSGLILLNSASALLA